MGEQERGVPAIETVMTPFPWYVHIEDQLSHALEVMGQHEIRHLPVTDEGELVGVVSERDIALVTGAVSERGQRDALRVRDACTLGAYVVECSEPLDRVLIEMADRRIGSVLVVRDGSLAGILTATDACRRFGEFLRREPPAAGA